MNLEPSVFGAKHSLNCSTVWVNCGHNVLMLTYYCKMTLSIDSFSARKYPFECWRYRSSVICQVANRFSGFLFCLSVCLFCCCFYNILMGFYIYFTHTNRQYNIFYTFKCMHGFHNHQRSGNITFHVFTYLTTIKTHIR